MLVCFTTDGSVTESGWSANYSSLPTSCPSFDFSYIPTPNWQTHSSSILSNGLKMYRFSVTAGTLYTFKTGCGDGATANYDSKIDLLNENCLLLLSNDDDCENNRSTLMWQASYSGYVYLKVYGFSTFFGNYTLAFKGCNLPSPTIVSGGGSYCNNTVLQASCNSADTIYWQGTTSGGTSTVSASSSQIVSTSGNYSFRAHNGCGWGEEGSAFVVINPLPITPSIGIITQPTCFSATGSVELSNLPTAGSWTLMRTPTGVVINGTGNSFVDTGLPPGVYNYEVTNSLGCTSTVSEDVLIQLQSPIPITGNIFGPNNVCQNHNSVSYSTPIVSNATAYQWTLPDGATGSSTTNSIDVSFGAESLSGTIEVTAVNSCGEGIPSMLSVNVNPTYSFTETHSMCEGLFYNWHGIVCTLNGSYTKHYTSNLGCDSNYTLNLTVYPKFLITENHTICDGTTYSWHGQNLTAAGTFTALYQTENGCDSIYTLNLSVNQLTKNLILKLYLEGLYSSNNLMNQAQGLSGNQYGNGIADVISIELRDAFQPYSLAYGFNDFELPTDGSIIINAIPCNISGTYYIVVKHRNSIETWSSTAIDFSVSSPLIYNFSNSASNAYGSNLRSMGNVFAIWGGDANQDGIVDGSDMSLIENQTTVILHGYYPEDVNGDGIVDASDMSMIENNSTAIIKVLKPQ
jgi:hypothetical protein